MAMQTRPTKPNKDKEKPLHFRKIDFSTVRKIDNSSILEMMRYDVHLIDSPRICPTNMKSRFEEIITRYISAEKQGLEYEMDYCLIQLSNLLLGSTSEKDIKDEGLMELHLRVQRHLRNPIYRSHETHLLGSCLFSNLLLEADIDLLTLARTKEYFFPLLKHLEVNGPRRIQDESNPTYYPGSTGSEMDRNVYPSGELFAVKLRKYLQDNSELKRKDAVCYFFDPYTWLNLYHDWGYIYELEESYSKEIYKKVPKSIEPIIEVLNKKKRDINFNINDYCSNKDKKLDDALNYILSLPLCSDSLKKDKVKELAKEKLHDKKNHGVVSSLILYDKFLDVLKKAQIAEFIPEELEPYKEDFLKDELGAICLHDLDLIGDIGIRLGLADSPHYFLLKFADVISDWGRTYKSKTSLYDFPILDHVLFGFNPIQCSKLNAEKYEKDKRGILVNIIFDFSNNERLLAGEIGFEGKSKDIYQRKNYEFEEFVQKKEELQSLDYSLTISGNEYQWFFFNLILIDRYGERYLIENSKNNVDLWWIIPPLFRENCEQFKNKEFLWFSCEDMKFERELELEIR